jgi:hypothetical protein
VNQTDEVLAEAVKWRLLLELVKKKGSDSGLGLEERDILIDVICKIEDEQ